MNNNQINQINHDVHMYSVSNVKDNQLKPITRSEFEAMVSSDNVKELITSYRQGNKLAKSKLPAFFFQGLLDQEKVELKNKRRSEQGEPPLLATRKKEWMKPSGFIMLDFDKVEDPVELFNTFDFKLQDLGLREECLALAHITPSGRGLRLVLKRTPGYTIQDEQRWWCNQIGTPCDPACKDISRLSYSPQFEDILFYNPHCSSESPKSMWSRRFQRISMITQKQKKISL